MSRRALAASALVFTLDGVPMLYNGMEVGDTTESGAPALFEKLPIFWPIAERRKEFPSFYKQMMALRRGSVALRRGTLEWLRNSDESRVVTFVRRAGGEEVLVAINFSNRPFFGSVEVSNAAKFVDVETRAAGLPALSLDPWGYRIFEPRIEVDDTDSGSDVAGVSDAAWRRGPMRIGPRRRRTGLARRTRSTRKFGLRSQTV